MTCRIRLSAVWNSHRCGEPGRLVPPLPAADRDGDSIATTEYSSALSGMSSAGSDSGRYQLARYRMPQLSCAFQSDRRGGRRAGDIGPVSVVGSNRCRRIWNGLEGSRSRTRSRGCRQSAAPGKVVVDRGGAVSARGPRGSAAESSRSLLESMKRVGWTGERTLSATTSKDGLSKNCGTSSHSLHGQPRTCA